MSPRNQKSPSPTRNAAATSVNSWRGTQAEDSSSPKQPRALPAPRRTVTWQLRRPRLKPTAAPPSGWWAGGVAAGSMQIHQNRGSIRTPGSPADGTARHAHPAGEHQVARGKDPPPISIIVGSETPSPNTLQAASTNSNPARLRATGSRRCVASPIFSAPISVIVSATSASMYWAFGEGRR